MLKTLKTQLSENSSVLIEEWITGIIEIRTRVIDGEKAYIQKILLKPQSFDKLLEAMEKFKEMKSED